MALQLTITDEFPAYVEHRGNKIAVGTQEHTISYYIRVEEMRGGRENGTALVSYSVDGVEVRQQNFPLPFNIASEMSGASSLAQPVYLYLKALPDFEGAVDA